VWCLRGSRNEDAGVSAYTFSRARAETRRDRRHVSVPRGACRSGPAIVFQAGDWTAKGLALPAGDTTLTVTRTAQDQTTAQAQASVTRPADATQFTHDPNGNMLGEGLWQYTWDEENRLVAVTPTGPAAASRPRLEYVYDGLGRRRLRRTYSWDAQGATWSLQAETRFVWDSWVLLRETTVTPGNGETLNRTYTCGLDLSGQLGGEGMDPMSTAGGIGGILAFTSSSSALPAPSSALFLYDGNGNAANLVDAASAATLATYEYGPFGNTLVASGPLAEVNPIRFSSKYFEGAQPPSSSTQPPALSPQPSLYYYGLRYYSPGLGRWASRDPIGETAGASLYAAVANFPTGAVDAQGLYECRSEGFAARDPAYGMLWGESESGVSPSCNASFSHSGRALWASWLSASAICNSGFPRDTHITISARSPCCKRYRVTCTVVYNGEAGQEKPAGSPPNRGTQVHLIVNNLGQLGDWPKVAAPGADGIWRAKVVKTMSVTQLIEIGPSWATLVS